MKRAPEQQAKRLKREGVDSEIVDGELTVTITKPEWDDFYKTQMAGHMNMMGHWNILKFMPDGNWQAAFDHFEDGGKNKALAGLPAPT